MTKENMAKTLEPIFSEIVQERMRQHEKWGEQNHPMLNIPFTREAMRNNMKAYKAINDNGKNPSWFSILMEEVYESFAENEPEKIRAEMLQTSAVAVQIIEYLDRQIGRENDN
jgi:hypothetical protein